MVKTAQRINRAYKVAPWSEIQRIYYTATLTAFIHQWARVLLSILIPSALTVLQFFAAINRASKNGYMGTAVSYPLLATQIALATGRPCSVRTLERGLAALKVLGLVRLHWWTMPDVTIDNGAHQHRIKGTGKVETDNGWKSQQIRIVVLTQRAISLWDKRSASKGSDIIPHFAPFLTSAKMAANPINDQVGKPTMIKSPRSKSDTSTSTCQRRSVQGQTTRPSAVEQLTSTPAKSATSPNLKSPAPEPALSSESQQDQTKTDPTSSKELTNDQKPCQDTGHLSNPGRPKNRPIKQSKAKPETPRGCSHTPPPLPKNAKNKTTWAIARAYLLVELHRAIAPFTTREANAIYERALFEMSPEYPKGFPTIVDWAYWVGRFATFSPNQRRAIMLREILPVLRSTYTPVPSEMSNFKHHIRQIPTKLAGSLAPMLQHFWDKFAEDGDD